MEKVHKFKRTAFGLTQSFVLFSKQLIQEFVLDSLDFHYCGFGGGSVIEQSFDFSIAFVGWLEVD